MLQGLFGRQAGGLLAAGPAAVALLTALRGGLARGAAAGVASAAAAPTAAGACAASHRRPFSQDAGAATAAHPHHSYADSHSPQDSSAYRATRQRLQAGLGQPGGAAPAGSWLGRRREEGPPPSHVLLQLGQRHGVPDGQLFHAAVVKLTVERQHGLLQHAPGVAQHLQSLGLCLETVGRMLQHCPALFSFPSEERAEVLLGELMGERCGRSAAQAAELFIRCPALANTRHVMPSIVRVVVNNHAD